VTCFDPDTPSGKGFWHWVLFDLPAEVTELPSGAGSPGSQGLPAGAAHARNGYGEKAYGGAAPPRGDKPHRYIFTVYALDRDQLGVDSNAAPDAVGEAITAHALARAVVTPVYGH
jgi:Raf kinase inhibitor-like YbhB/YbcL family protein